jgi:hypothetical protein
MRFCDHLPLQSRRAVYGASRNEGRSLLNHSRLCIQRRAVDVRGMAIASANRVLAVLWVR